MKKKRSTYSNASLKLIFISGQGGQGNVYSAVHIYTNLPVAVKVTNWFCLRGINDIDYLMNV